MAKGNNIKHGIDKAKRSDKINKIVAGAASLDNDPLAKNFSENGITVLKKRYLARDEKGEITETVSGMLQRVSKNIAEADLNYGKTKKDIEETAKIFFEEMSNLRFLPNSPTLMNAGRPIQQLSACFVLPIEDSMESIFETIKNTALIHQSGGGTGFSFTNLRPKNDMVHSTKGVSSGPVSFMQVFNSATEAIKQGGTRRGANMGILRIDHPDILDFITAKQDTNKLNNFNISVAITEDFMKRALKNQDYPLINPRDGKTIGYLNAGDVFEKIVEMAWTSGEPGIVFIDRINRMHQLDKSIGEIQATNPCGEQPLLPYESCNLGSINLGKFIKEGKTSLIDEYKVHKDKFEKFNSNDIEYYENKINWNALKKTIHTAVHFLDNVIDKNKYPLEKIKEMTLSNRKIGLGIMGYSDMLIKLGIPYNSNMALKIAETVMKFIQDESKVKSQELGEIKGSFPNFEHSVWKKTGYKAMRNATTTTIAPTGTISIIGTASSGIEPLFALAYERRVLDNQTLVEADRNFKKALKDLGVYSEKLIDLVAKNGSLSHHEEIPPNLLASDVLEYLSSVFVTAHEITPHWHVLTQAAFQKYTDNAVSKTVNFPNTATKEDIKEVYMLAYKLGLKGITVYRDGSRQQVLTTGKSDKSVKDKSEQLCPHCSSSMPEEGGKIEPRRRPDVIHGVTIKTTTGCGPLYVTINYDESGKPFEIFNSIGKSGGCAQSQTESTGRMVSLALRSGIGTDEIITQLKGIRCNIPYGFGENIIYSCADAIGKALEKSLSANGVHLYAGMAATTSNTESKQNSKQVEDSMKPASVKSKQISAQAHHGNHSIQGRGACPSCGGSNLKHAEGCTVCLDCGYSDCG